jgi:hypothetical protein
VELLLQTAALGFVSVAATVLLARSLVSPALLYWWGWLLGIGAAESLSGDAFLPVFTPAARWLILQLHLAATVGFLLAAVLYALMREAGARERDTLPLAEQRGRAGVELDGRVVGAVIGVRVLMGAASLVHRIAQIGGLTGARILLDIRRSYLNETLLVDRLPTGVRIYDHLELAFSIFPFLFALQDALDHEIRWRRLLVWWAAGIPGGLATGGRGWILGTALLYGATYLVMVGGAVALAMLRRWMLRLALVFLGLTALFGWIERVRIADSGAESSLTLLQSDRWYRRAPVLVPALYYLGIPTLAASYYADYAAGGPRYGGALTFPFVAVQLDRLGMSMPSPLEFERSSRAALFKSRYPILGATHATIIPALVGDFGTRGWLLAMAAIALCVQGAFFVLRGGGLVARLTAVQLVIFGGWWVFQQFMLGLGGAILPVLWLAILLATDRVAYDSLLKRGRFASRMARPEAPGVA